ncbi:hypothetical protein MKW92_053912 [Papaver armeniacum]|nr:hypothetical protein MKW92_053912 [Papaver armeniacum]
MDVSDWRSGVTAAGTRQRMIGRLIQSIERQLASEEFDAENILHAAARIEGDVYNSATRLADYYARICTTDERELVKRKLPVMKFGDLLRKLETKVEDIADPSMCPICLDCLKTSDEVRELSRCCHVFHKGCLDKWIDQQRFLCPYCRAPL